MSRELTMLVAVRTATEALQWFWLKKPTAGFAV